MGGSGPVASADGHGGADQQVPVTFAAVLADLMSAVQREDVDDDQLLTLITRGAVAAIAGAEQGCVVASSPAGLFQCRAAVGDLPPLVVDWQNQTGQGPWGDTDGPTGQLLIADVRSDDRWPGFRALAASGRLRSVLCTPIQVRRATAGSLTLLSTQPGAFSDAAANLADVFAAQAALALVSIHRVRDFQAMAASRQLIGQAQGILMNQYKITGPAAFDRLLRASQDSNIKLRTICEHLADTGELPPATRQHRK